MPNAYPLSDSEKMRDSMMQDNRVRLAEQREAALLEKLKILEAELAGRKPEGLNSLLINYMYLHIWSLI